MKNSCRRLAACIVLGLAICLSTSSLACDGGDSGDGGGGVADAAGAAVNNVAVAGGADIQLATGKRDYTHFSLTNKGTIALEIELDCGQIDRCGSLKSNKLRIEPGQTQSFNGTFGGRKIKLTNRTAGSTLIVSSKT